MNRFAFSLVLLAATLLSHRVPIKTQIRMSLRCLGHI